MDVNLSNGRSQSRIALQQCLAILVRKEGCQGNPGDFWMYENGYLLFQGLISANSLCWWNNSLNTVTSSLDYRGYINPGALLVSSEPCSLDILRNAWARRVLQPPQGYQIVALEEIEGCYVKPVSQTQWTPLPEAVCSVILRLSSQGKPAGIETIREALFMVFPHVTPPSEQALYDTLAQLSTDRKVYHTANGYFIVTPERRRSRSLSRNGRKRHDDVDASQNKTILMSTEEALVMVHGEMATIRDGEITHQCIQTNLADVISGGNASDKILYARTGKQLNTMNTSRNHDQRNSFRIFNSNRRMRRSASTRTLARATIDTTSSSTDGPHSDTSPIPKKTSLFSRIFRKSKRSHSQIHTYSEPFPPTEWFNSKAVHLLSVGTQTTMEKESVLPYDKYETNIPRSATLPRRHRRHLSGDLTYVSSYAASRESSPLARAPISTLPKGVKNLKHPSKSRDSSRKTSRNSLHKTCSNPEDKDRLSINDISLQNLKLKDRSHANSASSSHDNFNESNKNLSQVDNSGPSSIESHKSSRTGSSIISSPSSIESHKTVIRNDAKPPIKSNGIKREHKSRHTKPQIINSSLPYNNSFTLQVTTNQGNVSTSTKSNTQATTTINNGTGSNTKIFVQNSPIRSVITFENGQNSDTNPNLVIINGESNKEDTVVSTKNTNQSKDTQTTSLNNESCCNKESKAETMNNNNTINNRKLSLQLPSRESLNYNYFLKNIPQKYSSNSTPDSPMANSLRDFTKNSIYSSTPPSPTKEHFSSSGNVFIETDFNSPKIDKNILGSEPNIYCNEKTVEKTASIDQFPSLNDLTFNFTSLAAQKILKGVSINSVDTLVELSMAANNEKQNNCDFVRTDFGMV